MPEERTPEEILAEWRGKTITLKNGIPYQGTRPLRHQECREVLTAILQADYCGEVII